MPGSEHISEHGLERLLIGTITEEAELAPLEEHLLVCAEGIARGGETLEFVEVARMAKTRAKSEDERELASRFCGR